MLFLELKADHIRTEYVDALMNWVQGMLDDEAIFPSKIGASLFNESVQATVC